MITHNSLKQPNIIKPRHLHRTVQKLSSSLRCRQTLVLQLGSTQAFKPNCSATPGPLCAPGVAYNQALQAGYLTQAARERAGRQCRGTCKASLLAATAAAPVSSTVMQSLAVLVGWLVIAGSCIRSLPQIVRIVKNKSVEGLSLTSFTAELVAYTIQVAYNLAYNYPFSTYGDTVMCWIQNVIIVWLIFVYRGVASAAQAGFVAGFTVLCWYMFSGHCSTPTLQVLQAGTVVLLALGARVPQILLNVKRGNSGELSLLSTALSLAGNCARVLTTWVLVKDSLILAGAASQGLLNLVLLCQIIGTARRQRVTEQLQPGLQ